jgi:hypothetical protein
LVSRVVKSLPRLTSLLTGSVSAGILLFAWSLPAIGRVPASPPSTFRPLVVMGDGTDLGGTVIRAAG